MPNFYKDNKPRNSNYEAKFHIHSQTDVQLEEIQLLQNENALSALKVLQKEGYTAEQIKIAFEKLEPIPMTKVKQRQAKRNSLDMQVKTEVNKILKQYNLNFETI